MVTLVIALCLERGKGRFGEVKENPLVVGGVWGGNSGRWYYLEKKNVLNLIWAGWVWGAFMTPRWGCLAHYFIYRWAQEEVRAGDRYVWVIQRRGCNCAHRRGPEGRERVFVFSPPPPTLSYFWTRLWGVCTLLLGKLTPLSSNLIPSSGSHSILPSSFTSSFYLPLSNSLKSTFLPWSCSLFTLLSADFSVLDLTEVSFFKGSHWPPKH